MFPYDSDVEISIVMTAYLILLWTQTFQLNVLGSLFSIASYISDSSDKRFHNLKQCIFKELKHVLFQERFFVFWP